ncbi:LexA family transcriptional regulator [Streptococcus suis]|uniref:LexA family transcriptional regulator n=1 Tax=Streptococcus suis TaxID=1307 RepID=UPI000CF3CED7|nr:XRE family transcriptional regulator [Streptococcus suis]
MVRGRGKLTPQEIELMSVISANINRYLTEQNKKQIDLSRGTGIPPSTLTGYVKGTSLPIPGNVQKIADYFGLKKSDIDPRFKSTIPSAIPKTVSDDVLRLDRDLHSNNHKNWIRYGNALLDNQNTVENSKNTVNEPQAVYFTYNYYDQPASAGTGQYLNDVKVETIELPIEVDADFVVPIYGDSMEPEYHSGDYIFVKLSVDLSDGDIGVFAYNGEAYIKQLRITDQGAYLRSLNPDYDDIPITADTDFRTIGEVVEVYRER